MIKIKNITKVYFTKKRIERFSFFRPRDSFKALDNVSLEIKEGELFGLLGPNGAGKTTLMQIICGLLQPSEGEVRIGNKPPESARMKIGLMLGYTMIYNRITGYANLEYSARLYNVRNYKQKIKDLAEFLGLEGWLNEYVACYSTGMKSKLALARALIHNPDILLLDEPTLGLDPHIAIEVREKIKEMKKTIILTTHYMEEADQLSDRVGFLDCGRLIKVDTPYNLKQIIKEERSISLEDVFIKLTQEKSRVRDLRTGTDKRYLKNRTKK